jgi:O-antigen/teichoic acid export membrane protein
VAPAFRYRFASPALRASLGSVITAFAGQATLVVSGILAARLLGVQDRGYFALVTLLPLVLAQLGALGLPIATAYFIAREPAHGRAVVRSLAAIAVAQAILLPLMEAAILGLFFNDEPDRVLLAGLLAMTIIPAGLAQEYGLAILQGQRRFVEFNLLRLLPAVLYSCGVAVMFALGRDELPLITLVLIWPWIAVGPTTLLVAWRGLPKREAEGPPRTSALIRFGSKALLGSSSPIETFRVDQTVVGFFLSPAALGLYVIGMAFTNLPKFLAQSIGMVAYPHVASIADAGSARRTLWRFFAFTVILCFVVVASLEGLAGWLVPFFFGHEFAAAVPVTRILLVAAFFFSARRILTEAARGLALTAQGSLAEAASWVALLCTLPVLASGWGLEGVAVAVALSSAVSFGVLAAMVVKGTRRQPSPTTFDFAVQAAGVGVAAAGEPVGFEQSSNRLA